MRLTRSIAAPLLAAAMALGVLVGGAAGDDLDDGLPPPPLPKKKLPPVKPRVLPPSITTSFDPKLDGMPFGNNGDYLSPDGDCFGMSLLAIGNYLRRLKSGETPAPPKVVERAQDGDLREEAAAAVLQKLTVTHGDDDRDNPLFTQSKASPAIVAALQRIAKTGVPEVMGLYEGRGKDDMSHAIVLFGYRNGKLLIYDPDYPGETIEWPFDEQRGLGPHPKAGDDAIYGPKVLVSSTPADRYLTTQDVDRVRAACDALAKECTDHFPAVTATVEPAKPGKSGAARVVVKGKVSGGQKLDDDGKKATPAKLVWLVVNGKPVAAGRLAPDGTYRFTVPASLFDADSNDLRVVLTTKGGALGGFFQGSVGKPSATPGAAAALGKVVGTAR